MTANSDPKVGQRWRHRWFGVGVVSFSPEGHIHVSFANTIMAIYPTVWDFHKEGLVRVKLEN